MKKRITALLLCLVMAFSLIPTTVWADTCKAVIKFKVIPVYEDSSKNLGYDVDYGSAWEGTLPCTYTSPHSTNANHSIQIKGFHPSKMGWTVRTGYEWTGWDKTVKLSVVQKPTFSTYSDRSSSTSNFNGTGTHYVYMIYGSKTPTIPQPDFDTIFNSETVRVTDLNTTDGHGTKTYPLMAGRYAYVKNSDTQYTITVLGADYINDYKDSFPGVTHTTVDGRDKTITLNYTNNAWVPTPANVTFTVECEPQPVAPEAPTDDDIDNALKGRRFLIQDVVSTNAHSTKVFSITDVAEADRIDSSSLRPVTVEELQAKYPDKNYTSNPYKTENGEILYFLTVDNAADLDPYIDLYNNHKDIGVEHKYRYHSYTILEKKDTGWELYDSYISRVAVLCDPGPGDKTPDMAELLTVECLTADAKHTPKSKQYNIVEQGTVEHPTDTTWTYTVTLNRATYVTKFVEDTETAHTDKAPNDTITLTWTWKDGEWSRNFDDNPVIECECKTEIEPPAEGPTDADVKAALGNVTVTVKCINPGTKHTSCAYGVLGGNDGYQLTKNKDGTYNVVLNAAPFVKAYSSGAQTQKQAHELVSAATLTWVLTFDKESKKWVGEPKEAGVDDVIQTAHRVPVHVVIYRNGDTSKAYKDIALESQLPGTVIDLTKLKIGDYYQGDVEFYGWYDDGLWNVYKANVAAGEDAPAGLTTKTVNGWTNLKCMVYDLDKVVYFQSAEDLAAYQKDHSKNDGLLYTTTVRRGTTLPTADAPAATRAGYTFQHWSREGQSVNVTGQTVNGWTNLYGVWTITAHNIHAYARLNSYFAPLTAAEFEDTITLNADTLKRLGLGSYNQLGYIPVGTFNFAGMPLVDDMYFDDDTLDAVADAATDAIDNRTIDLRPGVDSSTAALIDWTVLYKTFNEEDMAPGYITDDEDSYQLSGNLDLATVAFNAGKGVDPDDVKNMPAVNYTYEGFGIHDFYFVGNVFDLPENVPTREGYIFKGWSAKRLGDIVVWSDPTTDAGAEDEPLYKAGDEYSITAQGVIFTAQWEKKTYTIAASLYLNDSESPVMVDSGAYKWTHRYGGEYGDTIDYQPMIDALKARALEADKANKPYDAEITLYFPGSDKVFNTAVTTYGQNTARWQEINGSNIAYIKGVATTSYQVIFKAEDGTEIGTKIVEYGKTVASADPGDKYGYNFVGWVDQDGNAFTFDNDGNSVTEITRKTVLTAQWAKKVYTVSFDSKGGTKVDSQIVEHGSTATKPGNPHRNDYTFKGWYLDGKKFDFSTPITGDITLVARWATKTSGGSNSSSDTTTKDNGKTVQSGKTFDGGIALYVGLSVLSATGSALVITKKKRG